MQAKPLGQSWKALWRSVCSVGVLAGYVLCALLRLRAVATLQGSGAGSRQGAFVRQGDGDSVTPRSTTCRRQAFDAVKVICSCTDKLFSSLQMRNLAGALWLF